MAAKAVEPLYCSFCGKNQHEVKQLIAGPVSLICDQCVDLCGEIVAEQRARSRIKARGNEVIVSKADAERLAWMNSWRV